MLLTGGDERPAPVAGPAPASTPAPVPEAEQPYSPAPRPGATQVQETDGRLAVGITEPNPNFVWPQADREIPEPFGRWRDAFQRLQPAYYRLVLDWPSLQPSPGAAANFDLPNGGCMREIPPCGPWAGVRDQLRAAAALQERTGAEVLVVLTGTPAWAAIRPGGCERAGIEPRSRPPRAAALGAYRNLVAAAVQAGDAAGVRLRYWSAWNEPNHPYFMSPQRETCSAGAPSVAIRRYVQLVRAMNAALDAAPGDQEYVLGELAGLDRPKPRSTGVEEFARALPSQLVCNAAAWSQHGYVGGRDPVDDAAKGLQSHGCPRAPEIWITETGVGAPRAGAERTGDRGAQRRACRAMHRRLLRWYEDPRVTAAFQYTLREDDRFPTGLVRTSLQSAYPVLRAWQAWGGSRPPEAPAPRMACA